MKHLETEQWLRKVVELARLDRLHEIPEAVVDRVKQMHPAWVAGTVPRLPRTKARLVFDTLLQPAFAGVRGGWSANRHRLYQAGRYSLDLHEQTEPGAATIAVVGQICDSAEPGRAMRSLPVVLRRGKRVVGLTSTNAFGEFQVEYRPGRSLTLLVVVDGEEPWNSTIGIQLCEPAKRRVT